MNSFEDILENGQIIKNLKAAVENERISHSYIFDAPEGMGKMTIARAFAKAALCSEKNGCGKCRSCIAFDSDNNPDVIYVKSKKKSIGVDEIREILKNTEIKPYLYKYKIFIVENADTMTAAAQNAFLKTLEEPPAYAVFILLSNNISGFLTTILSRCVVFRLKALSSDIIRKYLVGREAVAEDKAEVYAEYCQGSLGRAVEMSKSEAFGEMRETAVSLAAGLRQKDLIGMFKAVAETDKFKENIQAFLDIFIMLYRDSIVFKCFNNDKYVIQKDKLEEIKMIASQDSIDRLAERYEAVFNAKRQLKANGNFQMTMEVLFLNLKEK